MTASVEQIATNLLSVFGHLMKAGQGPLLQLAEKYDLTLSQMKILFVLSHNDEPMSVGDLASATTLSLPAAGRAIDSILRSDLVTRTEDPADRRVKRIALTQTGSDAATEIHETRAALVRGVVAELSLDERAALADALDPLIAALPNPNPKDKELEVSR